MKTFDVKFILTETSHSILKDPTNFSLVGNLYHNLCQSKYVLCLMHEARFIRMPRRDQSLSNTNLPECNVIILF